jgi:sec-independent protein translocase protein TatA
MFNLGAPEIILILLVFLILFGAKKIPELAQGLGKGIREFKKSMKDIEEDISKEPMPNNNKNQVDSEKKS